jgi:hypothetical protein
MLGVNVDLVSFLCCANTTEGNLDSIWITVAYHNSTYDVPVHCSDGVSSGVADVTSFIYTSLLAPRALDNFSTRGVCQSLPVC